MKRQMFLATALSAAFAVSVAAQNPPTTAQTPPSQEKAQQVTLTGCLTQSSASATGTTGTAGTSATPQFILTNATTGSGSPSSATGTSGAASATAGKSFKLMGSSSDLKDHVNAKVEVKGTIEKASAYPSGGAAAGTSASDKDMQTFRVTSVRKIADTCSGQ